MRRLLLAATACALAACASAKPPADTPPPPVTTSAGTWTYAFDAGPGLASATLSGADGQPIVRVNCQAPRGDLTIADWTFSRMRQGDAEATITVGPSTKVVAVRIEGDGAGRQALSAHLNPRDPLFEGLTPGAAVKIVAGGYTHHWAPGAASRINDVINSCRTLGS